MAILKGIADFIKEIEPLISWTLIIIGWRIVRNDNAKNEARHELRKSIDALISDIKSLDSLAVEYYTTDDCPGTKMIEARIKRDNDLIDARIKMLRDASSHFKDVEKRAAFRNHLTGSGFQTNGRKAIDPHHSRLMEISVGAKDMIDYLEAEYFQIYHIKFS